MAAALEGSQQYERYILACLLNALVRGNRALHEWICDRSGFFINGYAFPEESLLEHEPL